LFIVGSLSPANREFDRYAIEFLSRIDQAVYPAVAILAAAGAVWAWQAGRFPRVLANALLFACAVEGLRQWLDWFL